MLAGYHKGEGGLVTVADVPSKLASALDSAHPAEPEDYTEWEPDDETEARIEHLLTADNNDWDLKGDDE